MIDPSDVTLKIFEEGDEGVLPTATGGDFGEVPVTNYRAPLNKQPLMFRNTYYQMSSVNNKITPDAHDRPDYWRVKLDQTPSCRIHVYLGADIQGYPMPVESGDSLVVPGTGTDWKITLQWVAGTVVNVTVIAERGYPGVLSAD